MREAGNQLLTRPRARTRPSLGAVHNRRGRPVVVGAASFVGAYFALVAVMWGVATAVLATTAITAWDGHVVEWLAANRTLFGDSLTSVGTHVADTLTITVATVLAVAVLLARRHWAAGGLVAAAVLLKVTAFLTTTVLVQRARPDVPRLDEAPPTSSFPSGHVAASVAFWLALAVAVTWVTPRLLPRTPAWAAAVLVPPCVAASRLYRGMHFPTDVASGYLLGVLATGAAVGVVLVVATRARTSTAGTPVRQAHDGAPGRRER